MRRFTASATATATADDGSAAMPAASAARKLAREIWTVRLLPQLPQRSRLSPLTLRILAINVVALALLGGGLFYLGEYQQNLVAAQTEALKTQGQIFAAALGQGAVDPTLPAGPTLQPERAREMMRRLVEPTHMRARLFDASGTLIADSRILGISKQSIEIEEIAPPDQRNSFVRLAHGFYDDVIARIPWSHDYPPAIEKRTERTACSMSLLPDEISTTPSTSL